jgi:transmembrane sensor
MVGKAKAMTGTEPEMARAIEWMLLLRSGSADGEAVAGHRAWRSEHPSHEAAWERVSKALGAFETLRQRGVPGVVVRQTVGTASRRGALRATLGLAGMGVVGGGAGMLGLRMVEQQGLLADQHTGLAQRRQESLPDGGSLWLDARTAVDVAFENGQRELTLHHGRMLVRSSAAGAGLLQVRTAAGSLTAGDSRFVVQARRDRPLQVTAISGSVILTSATGEKVEVPEGRRLVAAAGRPVHTAAARGTESLWTRGLVSLDNEPLGELVESLQDYRSGMLRVSERAAQLRVSGVFSLDDTDRTLRALAETQPLRIAASTRYWVTIDLA